MKNIAVAFTTKVDSSATDNEDSLLDETDKALCIAFYVSIPKSK